MGIHSPARPSRNSNLSAFGSNMTDSCSGYSSRTTASFEGRKEGRNPHTLSKPWLPTLSSVTASSHPNAHRCLTLVILPKTIQLANVLHSRCHSELCFEHASVPSPSRSFGTLRERKRSLIFLCAHCLVQRGEDCQSDLHAEYSSHWYSGQTSQIL